MMRSMPSPPQLPPVSQSAQRVFDATVSSAVKSVGDVAGDRIRRTRNLVIFVIFGSVFLFGVGKALPGAVAEYMKTPSVTDTSKGDKPK